MTTIIIERKLLEEVVEMFDNAISTRYPHEILRDIRATIAAPATAPVRKPMTDEDTLDLFSRIQLRMRFTDADARPFASGVASAEFFHGIK